MEPARSAQRGSGRARGAGGWRARYHPDLQGAQSGSCARCSSGARVVVVGRECRSRLGTLCLHFLFGLTHLIQLCAFQPCSWLRPDTRESCLTLLHSSSNPCIQSSFTKSYHLDLQNISNRYTFLPLQALVTETACSVCCHSHSCHRHLLSASSVQAPCQMLG